MPKRVLQATVWARRGVSAHDWRYRGIFRFVLPATYLLFLWFGAVGWALGVGSVQAAASDLWQLYWSAGVAAAGLVAFAGVSFPRLWWAELIGSGALVALASSYIVLFVARGLFHPDVTAVAGLEVILILLPIWRVADLGKHIRGHHD